ncbi:MAG: sensor histidine kinase [Xanthobacteraceae bacterium]|nr:sensor histidine kinase [Xanthobacteraceae bacterium]
MSLIPRFLLPSRISSQMAVVIVVSLVAIHIIITSLFFLRSRDAPMFGPESSIGELVTLLRLVAVTPAADRPKLIVDAAKTFPRLELRAIDPVPVREGDLHFERVQRRLGSGFRAVSLEHAAPGDANIEPNVAVRLPDGAFVAARLALPPGPPRIGGPLVLTVLFIVVSMTLLGLWAARALTAPLGAFAKAADSFSLQGDIAPLPERGPDEIRMVAKAFNRMRERIQRLSDDRIKTLAAVGHDLRTPVTRMRLRAEFIPDEGMRSQMLRDLDQMKTLIESALTFLRDGQGAETATLVDVASLLLTICDDFADLGHTVLYDGPDHATLVAQPDGLARAVGNLIENAIRYGATVSVRLRTTAVETTIEVEDDGPGIIDADKADMLEPFVRGDASRGMEDAKGFGLGLSIARAVAEAHGGTLTLLDRAPSGLIARIALPVRAA